MSKCRAACVKNSRYLGLVRHVVRLHHVGLLGQVSTDIRKNTCDTRSGVCDDRHLDLVLHTDLIVDDLVVDRVQKLFRQVLTIVDTTVIGNEAGLSHAILHLRIVSVGVQQNRGVRQNVGRVYMR